MAVAESHLERQWKKEWRQFCGEAEMEKALQDQRRGLFYDGRLANQERKKANELRTFVSTLNHILKTLPPKEAKAPCG